MARDRTTATAPGARPLVNPYNQGDSSRFAKPVFISVIIPTYNRLPILQKCLLAMENQRWRRSSPI
ncbi:MAG TPA: hypothetical protein V6D46_02905, partial [Coleofasciculaceae cyanobacterium]